jgi:hypothetical protein
MWMRSSENEAQLQKLFEDLPPEALVARQMGQEVVLDNSELQRAEWFWRRRPGKLPCLQNAFMVLVFCLAFYIVMICFYRQITTGPLGGIILSAFFATLVVAFLHIYRYARWKSEYGCAIARLLQTGKR